jgi:hypothetical protein
LLSPIVFAKNTSYGECEPVGAQKANIRETSLPRGSRIGTRRQQLREKGEYEQMSRQINLFADLPLQPKLVPIACVY